MGRLEGMGTKAFAMALAAIPSAVVGAAAPFFWSGKAQRPTV
jgi:hypothetical protein